MPLEGPVVMDAVTYLAATGEADLRNTYALRWVFNGVNAFSYRFNEDSWITAIEHSGQVRFGFANITGFDNTAGVQQIFQAPSSAMWLPMNNFIPANTALYGFGGNGVHCLMIIATQNPT